MPTYDYRCTSCDHRWELFQSIKAAPVRKCPECGALKARRVIGPGAGILFKGSGFYQTDYRSESYKKGAEADRKAGDKAADSSTTGTSEKKSDAGGKTDSSSKSGTKES